jgi:phage shock protein A
MAEEGFFARLINLWRGILGSWIGRKEERNPEAVYESAIQQRLEQYDNLRKAVTGIVYLRNKLASEIESKSRELAELNTQVLLAVDKGEDEVALHLIQRKDDVEQELARVRGEMEQTTEESAEAKRSLLDFQGEIERLRREKERAMARLATLEARRAIQRQLDRLSPEADMRALESVRERVDRLSAELEAGREMGDKSLADKLREIRRESSLTSARAQLDELKKARQEKREAVKVEKTI